MPQDFFNPNTADFAQFDPQTRRLLRATVDWFETRGKTQLLDDDRSRVWPSTSRAMGASPSTTASTSAA